MPLLAVEKTQTPSIWGIWRIEEDNIFFRNKLIISREEDQEFETIRHPRKQLEWLASRMMMKSLIAYSETRYEGIIKDENGKPHLIGNSRHISLSHAFPYVIGIVDFSNPTGIDLELPNPKIDRIAHKFLNTQEFYDSQGDLKKRSILWSAKETLYKIHGRKSVIFKEHLKVEPFLVNKEGILKTRIAIPGEMEENYDLKYECYEKFVITYRL